MLHSKLQSILDKEIKRQNETIDLIASENFTSSAVREAVGSVFMHKYSEGYAGARYYEGNENIDELEILCIDMVKKVFKLPSDWDVNVQALAGSNSNLGVYNGLLNPGDKILSMYLPDGGHLSHGWSYSSKSSMNNLQSSVSEDERVYRGGDKKVSIVSKIYNVVQYKTDPDTNLFDYDFIEKLAMQEKPALIVTGGTAYARNIDYKRMREIADKVDAYYLADIAHEAGMVAGEALPSPVGIADVVTCTTHKVLRGPKGAIIMGKSDLIKSINRSIFPGIQGGPHNGTIAGIAQALLEADTNEFKIYASQVIKNAQTLAADLMNEGFKLVTSGTDKHLILIDLSDKEIGGKLAARALNYANIVSNMNTIPYESKTPTNPSGLRIGTPTLTTRGMKETDMKVIADLITKVINEAVKYKDLEFSEFDTKLKEISNDSNSEIYKVRQTVLELCQKYPLN
jgi:glycine hydroxymethyltransferase